MMFELSERFSPYSDLHIHFCSHDNSTAPTLSYFLRELALTCCRDRSNIFSKYTFVRSTKNRWIPNVTPIPIPHFQKTFVNQRKIWELNLFIQSVWGFCSKRHGKFIAQTSWKQPENWRGLGQRIRTKTSNFENPVSLTRTSCLEDFLIDRDINRVD